MAGSNPPDMILDVRPDLARGEEPLTKILTAADNLGEEGFRVTFRRQKPAGEP